MESRCTERRHPDVTGSQVIQWRMGTVGEGRRNGPVWRDPFPSNPLPRPLQRRSLPPVAVDNLASVGVMSCFWGMGIAGLDPPLIRRH